MAGWTGQAVGRTPIGGRDGRERTLQVARGTEMAAGGVEEAGVAIGGRRGSLRDDRHMTGGDSPGADHRSRLAG